MDLVERITKGWGVLVGVPALFVLALVYPHVPVMNRVALCSVRRFTGYDCPGCGLKSAFIALSQGRIRDGIDCHPLAVVVAGWLAYLWARALVETLTGRNLPALLSQRSRDVVVYGFLAALLVQWVLKLCLA